MPDLHWSSPEYHHYEKDARWFYGVLIIATALGLVALWQKNFLFVVFIAIAATLAVFWGRQEPRAVEFALVGDGLHIGKNRVYPYENIAGFAIVILPDEAGVDELVIRTKGRLSQWIKIIIAKEQREHIRERLMQKVPEIEFRESLADHLAHRIGF